MLAKLTGPFLISLMIWSLEIPSSLGGKPLNGKSLRIMTYTFFDLVILKRNETGHVISFDGMLKQLIEHLGNMYNFSYYILPDDPPTIDGLELSKGLLGFLVKGEADMVLGPIIGTPFRFKHSDFPTPFNDDTGVGCIVSYPKEAISLIASLKPLSYQVWILIAISAVTIIICLRFSEFGISRWIRSNRGSKTATAGDIGKRVTDFVWGNLVSQGQRYSSIQIAVRVAAGAWCAGCFFLIQIYCSTLTSHLMSPNQKPIISSVNDLPHTPGVSMTVEKGFGIELILRDTSQGTRNLKLLSNKLKSDPKSICSNTTECLKIVNEGHAAYCNAMTSLKTVMRNDLKTTGTCHYLMIKDSLLNTFAYSPLQKNSPYTESISRGIMIFKQSGLYNQWMSWYVPTPWQCMKLPSDSGILRRMSTSNLSSAFAILIIGYILSTIAFCIEKMFHLFSTRIQVKEKVVNL